MNMTSRILFEDLKSGANAMSLSCVNEEWKKAWLEFRDAAERIEKLYAQCEIPANNFKWPEDLA